MAEECFWYIKYPPTQAAALHVKEVTELVLKDKDLLATWLLSLLWLHPK